MPNINELLSKLNNPSTDNSKNVFEPSASHAYSMPMGAVIPLNPIATVPDGKYKIKFDELVHTVPFVTDPFVRLTKHIDVWFVPYSSLYHFFPNFIGESDEFNTSLPYNPTATSLPYFSLGKILRSAATDIANGATDMMAYNRGYGVLRLLDMLGYGTFVPSVVSTWNDSDFGKYDNIMFNPWNILAYNKIWNSCYRDKHHTTSLNPRLFNADFVQSSQVFDISDTNYSIYYSLFELRYRRGRSDIFRSSQTSRQFGLVSSLDVQDFALKVTDSDNVDVAFDPDNVLGFVPFYDSNKGFVVGRNLSVSDSEVVKDSEANLSFSIPNAFDVYAIKRAEMLQLYREKLGRAGKDVNSRAKAIYGVEPRSLSKDEPVFVGSTSFDIVSSQVTSTGGSEQNALGSIAGKGIGFTQQNDMEFTCTEFGVLMPVTYLLPTNFYGNVGFDKTNTMLERFDYFTSQLQNLGLEEIVDGNRSVVGFDSSGNIHSKTLQALNTVIGYLPRYWAYKTNFDKAHIGFGTNNGDNEIWSPVNSYYRDSFNTVLRNNLIHYVNPSDFDVLFGASYDGSPSSDPFVCNCRVHVRAVLPMSELGLVNW